jgi:hypothetical protein
LLLVGALVGGIAFFVKRRKKTAPVLGAPITAATPLSPSVAAPAVAPVQPSESIAEPVDPASLSLAPSEVVVLKGDLFAPSAGVLNSWKLVGTETKVSTPPLAQNMFAAAFLALEKAGDVRLEQGKKKVTFGLREVDTVLVIPNGQSTHWPAGSFEAKILTSARNRQASNSNTIKDIVYDALGQDASVVWSWALSLAHQGMASRGILGAEARKGLLSSGQTQYTLTPATSAALTRANPAAIQQLLQSCAQGRPGLFQLLNNEIKVGLKSRQEASDSGPSFD